MHVILYLNLSLFSILFSDFLDERSVQRCFGILHLIYLNFLFVVFSLRSLIIFF